MSTDVPDDSIQIGLEVHVQLTNLKSKLFCGCSTAYRRDPPNSHVCPTCLGLPGALPTVNKKAIEDAILLATALNSTVSQKSYFFRKNYYYPDMAKNFQISQYDKAGGVPIAVGGSITIHVDHEDRKIRITRLQLEEDPAKLVHLGSIDLSPYTLIDYNRAGVALLEVVTEPDLRSPREARLFLQKLRSILEHLGISDGQYEGSMRCDANISLSGGKRVEIKNISSFKEVERALGFEITRQRSLVLRGQAVDMETRHWDETRRATISLRSKEAEHDYRYFPEPDLVPIVISNSWITNLASRIPELPDLRRNRFIKEYALPSYDATVLTREKSLADFFEECVQLYPHPKIVSNWIMGDIQRWLHQFTLTLPESKITPKTFVELLQLIDEGTISGKIAKQLIPKIIQTNLSPRMIVEKEELTRIASSRTLQRIINQVFEQHPQAVIDALDDAKAIHFLIGQVMRATKGKADPTLTNRLVHQKIDTLR
ncbi:MAG: Asp-tRNA(Asn)/Glu-tRNA(Gln) amidotransferase subunit GatB [Candidatus Bathyarchaeota archaeon]|nr:Asp-tRNA(Asn)/Glu-tRNA(Gln) amidotransferase subunit GatB [Candidatus Bathyarchaeota archaeon]